MTAGYLIPIVPPQGGQVWACMRRHRGGLPSPNLPGSRAVGPWITDPRALFRHWQDCMAAADDVAARTDTHIDLWIRPIPILVVKKPQ